MKRLALVAIVLCFTLSLSAETWKNVTLMDAGCAAKKEAMASPEKHSKSCAMQCAKAGYGAIVAGKFVKFDANGSKHAAAALKKSGKKDHLTADVTGQMKDGMIVVQSLKMN